MNLGGDALEDWDWIQPMRMRMWPRKSCCGSCAELIRAFKQRFRLAGWIQPVLLGWSGFRLTRLDWASLGLAHQSNRFLSFLASSTDYEGIKQGFFLIKIKVKVKVKG